MSGVRGAVLNGVCANSCHAQDSACAAVWASANANASLANCQVPALLTLERFISSTRALEHPSPTFAHTWHRAKWLPGQGTRRPGLPGVSLTLAPQAACRQCAQCRFASFSLAEGVCVWQERCHVDTNVSEPH